MALPWTDPRLARIPIRDSGEVLVDVRVSAPLRAAGPAYLRSGLVDRLVTAQTLLPREVLLLIVDGYRPQTHPCRHPTCVLESGPGRYATGLCTLLSGVAPHPTGGAVDLTLVGADGPTCTGTPLPACCAAPIPPPPDKTRHLLSRALEAVRLVNHPTRWWHWSYGDRFWASATHAPHARYGPAFPES